MLTSNSLAKFWTRVWSAGHRRASRSRPRRSVPRNHLRRLLLELLEDRTCPSGLFAPALGSPFPVGYAPGSVAVGDFNGDGDLDLASANAFSGDVSVLLGDGSGGFPATDASRFPVGNGPESVAVDDLDGDGDLDLVIANAGSDDISVLLGDGSGGFPAADASRFPVGEAPVFIAVGDLDGDGDLDLATANAFSDDVSVLLGDGVGGFAAADGSPFPVGDYPVSVAVGDFDGDGDQDLVTANLESDDVSVLLGDGSGGFPAADASRFPVGNAPGTVAVDDLDGDGDLDLVIANAGSDDVSVLLGDGSGGFAAAAASPFPVGNGPVSVAVRDFDGDGDLDLATANNFSEDVSVLLNTTIDLTPPILTGLMDVTLEAASDQPGVHYTFEVSAADDSGEVTLTCTPESGAFFPLGVTTVTCIAVDPSGNAAAGSFTVTVVDATPPTLTAPPDVTINAWEDTSPDHTGTATATDNAGDPVVTYTDSFLVGQTATEILRLWSAADASGNVSTALQRITVITDPALLIPNLTDEVADLQLPHGPTRALEAKLEAALESLQAGEVKEAGNNLDAFIHHVNAQRGKQLTDAEADALIEAALKIIELLPEI
jgi:hypothetical protein